MKQLKQAAFWRCLSVIGLLALWGCGEKQSAVESAARDSVLLINNRAEPRDLDPHIVSGFPEYRVIKAIMEGLVAEHPYDSNQVEPGVAERWESDSEGRVWTFYLRECQWSNGDPVSAHDFHFAFRRILNPELGASYAGMLHIIENAEAFNRGELTDFEEVGVKVLDERRLEIRLTGPTPHFPLMLTHYSWFPVHRPTIERHNAFASRDSGWTKPENHVGNGPFILSEWRPNQRITVARNSYYWDIENVHLQAIQFFPVQDAQTEERMFRTGQIHKTDSVPFSARGRYRESGDPSFRQDPFFATGYLGLNTRRDALNDRRVRRALMKAIDRDAIVRRVTHSGAAASGFVAPGIDDYPYREHLGYDPERARELLAEAGYPGGQGFPRISLMTANVDTSRTIAEVLQAMWEEQLGIQIQIQNREWQVLISDMDSGNFDIFSISWVGDFMDPVTFLSIMRSGDGNNRTGFSNPRYDSLIAEAGQTVDRERRMELLAEAETLLMEEMPIIPLSFSEMLYLLHPSVRAWAPKHLADQPYKHVYFDLDGEGS